MSNDSASAGELQTGAPSDEAFDPASDAGDHVTSAEKSSLEVSDEENTDDEDKE